MIRSFDFSAGFVYTSSMNRYALFDHTADIGMEIFGRTRKELFSHAAWALTDILITRTQTNRVNAAKRSIVVEGSDIADVLINFLRELLYLFNGEQLVIADCRIASCDPRRLSAELQIEPFNLKRHAVKMELKAVTYHGLCVEKNKSGWKARVIFDV